MEKLQINPQAAEICKILQDNGHQAFIVGGCVRDLILGHKPKDWDITTSAKPVDVMLLFPDTYPTGLDHGTVTVAMGQGIENHFEVTTFRVEGLYFDGRRPSEVKFVDKLEEDLARRDLTINAIAYDPIANELRDPFNGLYDLKDQIIKAVGDPELRFQEDGLRIMRAARFAARFGYHIDLNTLQGMKNSIETLKLVSKERISDELSKTLMTNDPYSGLQILRQSGALEIACPLLFQHPVFLHFTNMRIKYRGDLETRLAFLYSNCPSKEVQKELINLKYSNKEVKRVIFLLDLIDTFGAYQKEIFDEMAYTRFIAKLKNEAPDAWEHTFEEFITLMAGIGYDVKELFAPFDGIGVWARKEMNINGDDLLAIGVKPGPEIKKILNMCYEEILEEPNHNTKNILINFVQIHCL